MAELGIIASVAQIADVGLRLSIRLYTFGEIVASADRSVISISKDVSLTSGVLKELGQLLDKDKETQTFSENAVQTADGVVKECLEVFQEMENILVKKMPSLAKGEGRDVKSGERTKRAVVMLERLKWGYLQPKLQLLRSNLDRLKSTLLLMLNVITYARQVSAKTESPSVIAEQRSLIEDLAHSNQEYVRKFEELKLGIESMAVEDVDDAPNIGVTEGNPSTTTRSLPGAHTSKFGRTRIATGGLPLQDEERTQSLSSRELTTATRSSPNAQSNLTNSLATPPNVNISNVFINTSVQTNIAMPPLQERGIPTTEAPIGFEQEALFKQLEHYSMLIKNLLKEVDEAQYKITFKSRLRVKGGIAGLHESERQELERIWGGTALQSAEQRLESLVEGLGEMPMVNRIAARDPGKGLPHGYMKGKTMKARKKSLQMTANLGLDNEEQEEAADWIPHPISDGRLSHLNPGTGLSTVEAPSNMPTPVNEAASTERRLIGVYEDRRLPIMLSKARVEGPHKIYSNNDNRAPAAPMTSYLPFSYGGQSPQGVPQFYGPTKNEITQENFVLPALKNRRASNNVPSPPALVQAPNNRADVGRKATAVAAAVSYVNSDAKKSKAQDPRSRSRTRRNSVTALPPPRDADDANHLRRASVNNFGYGGSNVLVIREEAPAHARSKSRAGGKRDRSKSRIRQGLPVAAAGLGSAAIAGLYERNGAGKKDKEKKEAQYTDKDDAIALSEHLSHSRKEIIVEGKEEAGSDGYLLAPQPQDTAISGVSDLGGGVDESYSMPFNSDLKNPDILENFDFEQFLQSTDGEFNLYPSLFEARDGFEIGGGPNIRELFDLEQSSRKDGSSQSESAERVMKEVKADDDEKIIESIESEHDSSTPSGSTFAVDEAAPKHPARASLTKPDDRNKFPSLGGIYLPAEPIYRPSEKQPLLPPKDVKTLRKELTELPNQADQPATDSRPQLPPIRGLGLAINIMPPHKDDSSVIGPPPIPSNGNIVKFSSDISSHADPTFLSTEVLADRAGDDIHEHGSGLDHIAKERAETIDYTMIGGGPQEQHASSADSFQRPPGAEHSKDDGNLKRLPALTDLRSPPGKGTMDTANELVAIPKIDQALRSAEEDAARSGFRQRKRRRDAAYTARACTACRHQRIKCDNTRPKCVHCEQSGSECSYENDSRGQRAGPHVSSHTETDLEHPSQILSRKANSERDLEQSTGDAAALGPNWRIARATSEAYREVSSLPVPATLRNYKLPACSDDVLHRNRILELASPTGSPAHVTERRIQKEADTFQCALCQKKFTRAYSLRAHLRTHTGERPFPCQVCGEAFARLFDLKRHMTLHSGKESRTGEHDPGSNVDSNIKPGADSDLSLRLDDSRERAPSMMEASGPTYHPSTMSPSTPAIAELGETQGAATAAASLEDPHLELGMVDSVSERERVEPWQRESEQGESRLADLEVADRLVLLWTTVKPL